LRGVSTFAHVVAGRLIVTPTRKSGGVFIAAGRERSR